MIIRIRELLEKLKGWLGPLGWGSLIVFTIVRCRDVAGALYKLALGRWLEPIDFGAIDPFYSVLSILGIPIAIIFQIGVKSLSRLHARGQPGAVAALARDLAKVAAVGSVFGIFCVLGLRHFILTRLHLESDSYVWILGFLFALSWWHPMYSAVVRGTQRFKALFVSLASPVVLWAAALVFIVYLGLGLKGALLARCCASAFGVLAVLFCLRPVMSGKRESYSEEAPVMRATLVPVTIYVVSMALLCHFDRLYVRNFILHESGGFGAIVTLGMIPVFLIGPVLYVVFPVISAEHASGGDVRRFYRQAALFGLLVTIFGGLGSFLLGDFFMRLWSEDFAPYSGFLPLYSMAMGMQGTISLLANSEIARHRYRFLWFLPIPVLVMCGGLGVVFCAYSWRAGLFGVIVAGFVTRLVILAGLLVFGLYAGKTKNHG